MEKEDPIAHDIMFELKARKFVEMVREYSLHVHENQSQSSASSFGSTSTTSINEDNEEDMDVDDDSNGQQLPEPQQQQQQQQASTIVESKKRSRQSNSSHGSNGFMDSGLVLSDEESTKDTLLEKIMDYGQKLKEEYRYDQRPEVQARLKVKLFFLSVFNGYFIYIQR